MIYKLRQPARRYQIRERHKALTSHEQVLNRAMVVLIVKFNNSKTEEEAAQYQERFRKVGTLYLQQNLDEADPIQPPSRKEIKIDNFDDS
jgi:hypothetical protein